MKAIGIDPGLDGALAVFCRDGQSTTLSIADMPTREVVVNGAEKRTPEMHMLAHWFDVNFKDVDICVIEKVHAMPKQGVTSSFNFGFNAGVVQGMAYAFGLPVVLTPPNSWKHALKLSSDKKESIALARKVFPYAGHYFTRAKDDGRAEAALLAWYGAALKGLLP